MASFVILVMDLTGNDWAAAMRDAALSNAPLAGLVSNIGILLMGGAGLFGTLAAARCRSAPLAGAALFCLVFALDDGLMLHERLDRFEVLVFPVYGFALALVWWAYARAIAKPMVWPIAFAFAGFIASAVVDHVWETLVLLDPSGFLWRIRGVGYALEDLPKFAALVVLSAFTLGEALRSSDA